MLEATIISVEYRSCHSELTRKILIGFRHMVYYTLPYILREEQLRLSSACEAPRRPMVRELNSRHRYIAFPIGIIVLIPLPEKSSSEC